MNHDFLVRNRFIMSSEALDVDFHRFLNITQRLSLRFTLAVASSQGGTERMITSNGFLLQNYGIIHPEKILAISEIVKLPLSYGFHSTFFILHSKFAIASAPAAQLDRATAF